MEQIIMDDEDAFRAQRRQDGGRGPVGKALLASTAPPVPEERSSAEREFYHRQGLHENTALIELLVSDNCLSREVAVDVSAAIMENKHLVTGRHGANGHAFAVAGDHVGLLRAETALLWKKINDLWDVKQRYERNGGERDLAEACMFLILGQHSLAGASSVAELVKRFKGRKGAVNKCLDFFQDLIPELGLLPGQRNKVARKNMSTARVGQIPEKK